MAKLLFTLGAFLLIGLTLLGLRVHRWEYERQSVLLTQDVRERSVPELWGQNYELARETNPLVLPAHMRAVGLDVPTDALSGPRPPRDTRNPARGDVTGDLLSGLGTRGPTTRSGRNR